jgi:hypothetical protein
MSAESVLEYLKNREFQKSAVCFLGCIGLLGCICAFLVVPQFKKVHAFRNELVQLDVQSRKYASFDKFKDKLPLQRQRIASVLQSGISYQLLADRSERGIFMAVGSICEKADVKVFKIDPIEGKTWRINIRAPYRNLVTFISLLEQSFNINKFRITSGRNAALHSAELTVYPIEVPVLAATEGKDVFDLYAGIEAPLKSLEARVNTGRSDYPLLKDPLFFGDQGSALQ